MATILETLLDANARFALDAKGTTNHCPMALIALAGMGATDARLHEFYAYWEREYAYLAEPSEQTLARSAWRAQVGRRDAFHALCRCFEAWIDEIGSAAVVAAILDEIPPAPASIAFHAWIRLAYGIESAHRGEIAAGLSALVVGNLPIALPPAQRVAASSVDAGLRHLSRQCGGMVLTGDSITTRLRAVAHEPRFIEAVQTMPDEAALLDTLARTALAAYWQTRNFTVLHMVTATHAARRLFSILPAAQVRKLEGEFWFAFCAAYVSVGAPELAVPDPAEGALPEWRELCEGAVASNNDHVIKLIYTCYREAQRDPLPLYRQVAARALV